MTPTAAGAEDWMGQDTLEDFLRATKRIWVAFTVWTIHSFHYIMSYQAYTHLQNVSIHPQWLAQLPEPFFMQQFTAFVNEWTLNPLCEYHGCARPAEIFHQEINLGAICMKNTCYVFATRTPKQDNTQRHKMLRPVLIFRHKQALSNALRFAAVSLIWLWKFMTSLSTWSHNLLHLDWAQLSAITLSHICSA